MTKTITITDIADLRAGDIATCSYDGHEFTGEAWPSSTYGPLFVGASFVRYADGSPNPAVPLISATRALPDLPIELGSVIANVVTRDGCHYDWAMPVTGPANSLGSPSRSASTRPPSRSGRRDTGRHSRARDSRRRRPPRL